MKFVIDVAALVIALGAVAISYRAWQDADQLNRDTLFITTVNTRINTCTTLSNYHRVLSSGEAVLTDQQKTVSSTQVRSEKEANLSRALTLCLVDYVDVNQVRRCVGEANANGQYKVHDIIAPGSNATPPRGADILAC